MSRPFLSAAPEIVVLLGHAVFARRAQEFGIPFVAI